MFTSIRPFLILSAILLSGCAVEHAGAETVGAATEAVDSSNSLTINSLTINSLTINSLTINSLTINSLSSGSLGAPVTTALQDTTPVGAANRSLFHYMVGCALTSEQSVTYTWTDSSGNVNTVTEQGSIGLAPTWATGSLNGRGQQLVSACVASRVNYFGVTVPISVRNHVLEERTSASELATYDFVEGAFWGNLFSNHPALYSCYNPATVANSRADQRDCATGYLGSDGEPVSCGPIQLTGSCKAQCAWFDPEAKYYGGCGADGTDNAITTGLLPAQ